MVVGNGFPPGIVADSESFFAAEFIGYDRRPGTIDPPAPDETDRPGHRVVRHGRTRSPVRVSLSCSPGKTRREQAAELLAEKSVVLAPPEAGGGTIPPAATDHLLIPSDATPQLAETLRIKIFSPDKLTVYQLRQALGLPLVNEPVPDGVYLIVNDAGLGRRLRSGRRRGNDPGRRLRPAVPPIPARGRDSGGCGSILRKSETEFSGPRKAESYDRSPSPDRHGQRKDRFAGRRNRGPDSET